MVQKATKKSSRDGKVELKRDRNDKGRLVGFILTSVAILLVIAGVAANFPVIRDIVVGMNYQPSSGMEQIRADLRLTGTGQRIFNAVKPELMERAEFNQNCREIENESAILGCFRDDRIFIYNIVDEELVGIRELTTAHELLHAVYKRTPDAEKAKWTEVLSRVYEDNKEVLGEEIDIYPEEQKMEELYVRAGTEIRDLPEELELHYAEIFEEQDKIVEFYNGYIGVFRKIEKRLLELLEKINRLTDEISSKTAEYESQMADLNAEVNEFNDCAKTADCFDSDYEFGSRRASLMARQGALGAMYDEINELISSYNSYAAEYNENLLHGQVLNKVINSSVKAETVED